MVADELQCMFLEGKLHGFKEEYINTITRKLRIGELPLSDLSREDSELKEKILEASSRLLSFKSIVEE